MLTAIVVLALVRIFFIFKFAGFGLLWDHMDHMPLFLLNALRFDAQVGAYVAVPIVLCALLAQFWPATMWRGVRAFMAVYVPIVATLLGLLGLADVHYYSNFGRHFDIVAFDFFDEEPSVLIRGILDEAPILLLLIGGTLFYLIAHFGWKHGVRLVDRCADRLSLSAPRVWSALVVVLLILGVSFRGSLGTFTLRPEDVYVSASKQVNDCVPNCVFMLIKAFKEKRNQVRMLPDQDILTQHGFASLQEAADAFTHKSSAPYALDANGNINVDSLLVTMSGPNPPFRGYNVVLLVCESLGQKMLDYQSRYGVDMMGSLAAHLDSLVYFHNFVSATNGTIDAVETFTTSSPYERLFTSRHATSPLPYSTARVFERAGYSTHFVSGIEISWRNLIDVLPYQGFQTVTGKFEILDQWPDAPQNRTWGVYDHAMLSHLLDLLEWTPADGKPRFVMALTSTNHTPFEFPSDFNMPALQVPQDPDAFAVDDPEVVANYVRGIQYTCQSVGNFLTRLRQSPVGQHTIVAITGDHNTRLVLPYPPSEDPSMRYRVPLFLYIPNHAEVYRAYTHRFGSHHDIVPTLVNLTLPNAPYLNAGANLFSNGADTTGLGSYGVNSDYLYLSPAADSAAVAQRIQALGALKQIWFKREFEKQAK